MNLFAVLALGLFLGVRHATDADHVVAVSTIVTRQPSTRAALRIGALWGLGHTVTIVLVGGAIVLFGLVIPPRMALWMEMFVALMLMTLGVVNVRGGLRGRAVHSHSQGSHPHPVPSVEPSPRVTSESSGIITSGTVPTLLSLRPLAIGIVHGLAGSAALALLVLTTIGDAGAAMVYLGVFGVGTIIGMMCLTTLVALPLAAASRRFASFESLLALSTGGISVAFGVFLAYQLIFDDGLLMSVAAGGTP